MFFKKTTRSLFIFSICLASLSCGVKTGEKLNTSGETLKVESAQCLRQSIVDLKIFFKGDATESQVNASLSCIEDVFIAFKNNIQGQNRNSYTPAEVLELLNTTAFKDSNIILDQNFLNEIMEFKVALLGGRADIITKQEVKFAVTFLSHIRPDVVRLAPHMKLITGQWTPEFQPPELADKENFFNAAKNNFNAFIQSLSTELAQGQRPYELDRLMNFIVETARFAKIEEKTVTTIEKARPFLKKFKAHLIGGGSALQGNDWPRLGLTVGEAYFQSLRIDYFLTPLTEDQVDEKSHVYQNIALDLTSLFDNLLASKGTQALTNDELYDLLQPLSDILPKVQVNQNLLVEIGDLKVMFLGQNGLGHDGWSRADFIALNKKIPTLIKNFSTLIEAIKKLSSHEGSGLEYAYFEYQELKIKKAVFEISNLIESSYDLESLKGLLNDLALTLLKGSFTPPDNIDSLFRVLASAKLSLTGQPTTNVSRDNVKTLLNVGSQGYLNYTEYRLFLSKHHFQDPSFVDGMILLWPKIESTLLLDLDRKNSNNMTSEELSQLILVLQAEKFLKLNLKEDSILLVLNGLWSHILNPPENRLLNSLTLPGLNQVAVKQLSNEINIWLQGQKNISQLFSTTPTRDQKNLAAELEDRIQHSKDNEKESLTELKTFVQQFVPLNFDENGFLKILTPDQGIYNQQDLTNSNWARALARVFVRSYATDLDRVTEITGITLAEAEVAFSQFKGAAVDLELLEESNKTFVASRFREANLFLSESNGDQYGSFSELHQVILHIYSGINRAAVLKDRITRQCMPAIPLKVTPDTDISEDCAIDQYVDEQSAFAGLPQFLKMQKGDAQVESTALRAYYLSLLKSVGHIPNEQKVLYFRDADLFPHIVQYIEMVYARHDLNGDGFLQKDEALKAFPIFKDLLKEAVKSYKQITEDDLPGVFIYILKYGEPPKKTSIADLFKFIAFIRDREQKNWDIQSTRIDLGKVFNYIADITKPPVTPPGTPAPLK